MIKRTMGRFLLTVLVITGLAGTIKNTSISIRERKTAINLMKTTRADMLESVTGLKKSQLNYKAPGQEMTIRECMYHITISEKKFWQVIETALQSRANPEARREIRLGDDEVVAMMEDPTGKLDASEPFESKKNPYRSMDAAIAGFKKMRNEHIKYMRSTTEDLRNHVVQMPFGKIDCYQLCLMVAAHTERHRKQIEDIRHSAGFPK